MTHRTPWSALPPDVVAAIEAELGARVVIAQDMVGGYSPSIAAIVTLADGQRAFIKAVTAEINEGTVRMMHIEAHTVQQIQEIVATPALRFEREVGDWYVLGFEHVDGRHVDDPIVLLDAVDELHDALAGVPVTGLAPVEEDLAGAFSHWAEVAKEHPQFAPMAELAGGWRAAARGDHLLHVDVREDNALIDTAAKVWFVDWANACIGAPIVDAACAVPALVETFGISLDEVYRHSRLLREADPSELIPLAAGLAGYFAVVSMRPDPPGMPTVRAAQRAKADPALDWLRSLVGDTVHVPTAAEVAMTLAPDRGLA